MEEAREKGREAFAANIPVFNNPYNAYQYALRDEWRTGWMEAWRAAQKK